MSLYNKHNENNRPQEKFVRFFDDWNESVILGGNWINEIDSGSRASDWYYDPSDSFSGVSTRGVCNNRRR